MDRVSQDEFFEASEGDRYFERNREALRSKTERDDPPLRLVLDHDLRPATALELGCADGFRLERLRRRLGCRGVGVDASRGAIASGRADYPELELHTGTLADVPLAGRQFDLVIVHFVFHWNARETLLRACAEVDRLARDGGHLIVGDFLPDHPARRRYHHARDTAVYTYKQDYARIFTASNLYAEVARYTFDTGKPERVQDAGAAPENRGMCALLRKSLTGRYADQD